jgi:hypothetical protein
MVDQAGLHIFPCKADKTPCIRGGHHSATNDPRIIRQWWGHALLGAPCGPVNGFDVLDVDRGGEDWLATYEATWGLPATRIVGTKSGGLHLYFQHRPGMKCSAGLMAPNIDIRSAGGYVILWDRAGLPVLSDAPIAAWPGPMLELWHAATEARSRRPAGGALRGTQMLWQPSQAGHEVPRELYFKVCRSMAPTAPLRWKRRVLGLLNVLVRKTDGRNVALNTIGFAFRELIGAGVIIRANVESLLLDASTLNGYIQKRGRDAAARTIRSGLGPVEHEGPTQSGEEGWS